MRRRALILFAAVLLAAGRAAHAAPGNNTVGMIDIDGAIGPATADYISRAIRVATERHDVCLIIQLDTPGGLVSSMQNIVRDFYESRVPVVVYVAPPPAMAASAGTYITMAATIAAMAPHTTIGAAHPVNIGLTGQVEKTDSVMKQKEENVLATLAESIAEKRHRNAQWARAAVLQSLTLTSEQALKTNVIDIIADNVPDLLKKLDGRKVDGETLHTAGAQVVKIPHSFSEKFLNVFLRPEVMFVLMLVVIYGIIGELSSPGAILPGVAGAIALILVLYMGAILPVNIAGIVLILLAIAMFVIDIYSPTHGVLTLGGIVAFFLGALMLFNPQPGFRLPLSYIIPGTLVTAAFFLFVVGSGLRAQRLPVRAGRETMLGKVVPALSRIGPQGGKVFVEGEIWNAVSEVPVEKDQPVEIIGIEGLTLKVKLKA